MGAWISGTATAGDDKYVGDAGVDIADGLAGQDVLDGGLGGDTLNGGDGDDFIAGEGVGADYYAAGADTIHGGAGDDVIFGGGGADLLHGDDGDDSILNGAGNPSANDGYVVQTSAYDWGADVIDGGAGRDWAHLNYRYANQAVVLDLSDADAVNAITVGGIAHGSLTRIEEISFLGGQGDDRITGGAGNDMMSGGDGNDWLVGGGGGDLLRGELGHDVLIGGLGDDIYSIDDVNDTIVENPNEGFDQLTIDYAFKLTFDMADYVNVDAFSYDGPTGLQVTAAAGGSWITTGSGVDTLQGGAGDDALVGGAGNDTLRGGDGGDMLEGGLGADMMIGGRGDDTYSFYAGVDPNDAIVENANEGVDTVLLYDAATISLADNVENVSTMDRGAVEVVGNALRNRMNAENSTFFAVDFSGGDGDDWLSGGQMVDHLRGDAGDDVLAGNGGDDTLEGGAGADVLYGGAGADTLDGGSGNDELHGGDGDDHLAGGDGNDILDGRVMTGGAGDDTYQIDEASDAIIEASDGGYDRLVVDVVFKPTFDLAAYANVEAFSYTGWLGLQVTAAAGGSWVSTGGGGDTLQGGAASDTLLAGWGDDMLSGGDGNDVLDGDMGADTMAGGRGDDTYNFHHQVDANDKIVESAGEGVDTVVLQDLNSQTFLTLADNVEHLSVLGAAPVAAVGNALENHMNGQNQAFAMSFSGGGGDDTLTGGDAADVLWGEAGNDILAGNAGDDTLGGGDGADYLDGGAGSDTLDGGAGNDILIGGGGGDSLTGGAGNDTFRYAYVADSKPDAYDIITDFTVGSDLLDLIGVRPVEVSLVTSGAATFVFVSAPGGQMTIAANGQVNGIDVLTYDGHGVYMIGDGAANTLIGGIAGDVIQSGAGDDVIIGGGGGDVIFGQAGADTITYRSAMDSNASGSDGLFVFETGVDKIDLGSVYPKEVSLIRSGGSTFLFANTSFGPMQLATIGYDLNGQDIITGDSHGIYMIGDETANTFIGGVNADIIQSGDGDDVIIGGGGGDVLYGQAGADVFRYLAASDSTAANTDSIFDFQSGVDKLDLTAVRTGASDVLGVYSTGGSTFVFVDLHGDGVGDMTIQLTGTAAISSGDYLF
ncbi:calcium-binding protein [Caulobacter sp. LjRoot300]|uniref:calcium-binding protein n=1 Tax=Caulobacter sp. LjRoot300 TaxID=3342321 RepID=UPI003ECECC41